MAGEASADLHGSLLVQAIRRLAPRTEFCGIGGDRMASAGVNILFPSSDMAVVGLTEVIPRLRVIARAYFRMKAILKSGRPDLLILLDYPEFNLHLARVAKASGVPVLYYISPQVWAWRAGRVKKLAQRVDRMAVILPFEEEFYRRRGMTVDYVGHPLLEVVPSHLDKGNILREWNLSNRYPLLGILPGSRREEVTNLLPVMLRAAEILASSHPGLACLLPLASTIPPSLIQSIVSDSAVPVLIKEDIYRVLAACDLALVASGTATLETAIMQVPMVIVYRVSPVTFWFGKKVIQVPYIGLVNLIAGEEIVPELVQGEVTPKRLAEEALALLDTGQRRENMLQRLGALRDMLGRGSASSETAKLAVEMMAKRPA